MKPRERSEIVRRRLEKIFGRHENDFPNDPMCSLVKTILSQNTTDVTSERAWVALRKRYPTMNELKNADIDELAETIKVGGLARLKAERILNALRMIEKLTGELSLDFLKDMTEEEADNWLSQLKGVGPKTRAIVLLFALKKKAFPVDTHILRVTKRLGLTGPTTGRLEAQKIMAELARPQDYFSYHINLIEHGRRTCSALRPRCDACPLSDICLWSEKDRYGGRTMGRRKKR